MTTDRNIEAEEQLLARVDATVTKSLSHVGGHVTRGDVQVGDERRRERSERQAVREPDVEEPRTEAPTKGPGPRELERWENEGGGCPGVGEKPVRNEELESGRAARSRPLPGS